MKSEEVMKVTASLFLFKNRIKYNSTSVVSLA